MPKIQPNRKRSSPTIFIPNPEQFAANLLKAFELGSAAFARWRPGPTARPGPYSSASEMSIDSRHYLAHRADVARRTGQDVGSAGHEFLAKFAALWNNVLARTMGVRGAPLIEACGKRQSLQGSGMVQQRLLRFLEAGLFAHYAMGGGACSKRPRGSMSATRQKAEFYFRQISSALSPSKYPIDQSGSGAGDLSTNGRNLVQGMSQLVSDMERRAISSEDQPDGHLARSRSAATWLHDARQDRIPERGIPAHPVHADDREGARAAAAHGAALDQQVLHSRSDAGEELREVRRRPGLHSVSRVVGEPGPQPVAQDVRRLHDRRRADGDRRRASAKRTHEQINVLGYCVGGTLLGDGARLSGGNAGEKPFKSARS